MSILTILILHQNEFVLVQIQKEYWLFNHTPFHLKKNQGLRSYTTQYIAPTLYSISHTCVSKEQLV